LENRMGVFGDNPSETLGQMLSAFSGEQTEKKEDDGGETKVGGGGGFDPSLLLKLQGLMGNQQQADERSTLLLAIRPFLSEERRPQVDQAVKLLKLSQLAKTAQELELFKNLL